ncbi:hypothetical protein [Anabaena sp. UHCC 0451]|uniref:hypothetical protein n=1 Tax=Anabaena sp. UHCC 0451 TaxID=2055235 RepID=UPI002B2106E1|nr:hypothetical protein [Anabaena sp. UHCC 0451]MEA5579541.1 hypothetical protein [Anabaena sp. UHCC 0451]
MIVRLYSGYGHWADHELPGEYLPNYIFWTGFLYRHIGNGHYKSEPYLFISPNDTGIKGGQK